MTITKDIQDSIHRLTARLRTGLDGNAAVEPLLSNFEKGNFFFEAEPWHDISHKAAYGKTTTPAEYLLRVNNQDAESFNLAEPVGMIYQNGLYALFDTAVVLASVDQALRDGDIPVSINISTRNASDFDALTGLDKMLRTHFQGRFTPDQIIFEFLEDDQGAEPSAEALNFMREQGYKFALDDITDSAFDDARLKNLGAYADFVKIDGHFLSDEMTGDSRRLEDLLQQVSLVAPKAQIICEWVNSAENADLLRQTFPQIGLVQGRDLVHDRSEFSKQLTEMAKNGPHRFGPFAENHFNAV